MSNQTLTDVITEHRVMAAMIAGPALSGSYSELQEIDFSDPRCQHVLRAIRSLQACEADVGLDELDREIRLQDLERTAGGGAVRNADGGWTLGAGQVADKAGFWFIAEMLINAAPYRGQTILADHDVWWLRELADRRASLSRAA